MDNLKTLTIIRHGDYSGENLNSYGKQQMEYLAKKLKSKISGNIAILSSAAPRAEQSAAVIASAFNMSISYVSEAFWSDRKHTQRDEVFMRELNNNINGADHVILVSHLEYVEIIPHKITRDMGFKQIAGFYERAKGSCVFMNMIEKTFLEIEG